MKNDPVNRQIARPGPVLHAKGPRGGSMRKSGNTGLPSLRT